MSAPTLDTRLSGVAALERGWCEGSGEPVTWEALGAAHRALIALGSREFLNWGIVPTGSGGVSLQHADVTRSVGTVTTIEIEPDGSLDVDCLGLCGPGPAAPRLTAWAVPATPERAAAQALRLRSLIARSLAEESS